MSDVLRQDDPVLVDALKNKVQMLQLVNTTLRDERNDLRRQLARERNDNDRLRAELRTLSESLDDKLVPLVRAIENHLGVSIYDDGWSSND